ncbi:MAG: OsmC family protein [Gemmatimonadota bacterium]
MATERHADVTWRGDLKDGSGEVRAGSGSFEFQVSFGKRFGDDPGTNPEELIAAAHAVCYSMALANTLAKAGKPPTSLRTRASVSLDTSGAGPRISRSALRVRARVDGLEDAGFQGIAEEAERGCPVSNALRGGLEITLDATLEA